MAGSRPARVRAFWSKYRTLDEMLKGMAHWVPCTLKKLMVEGRKSERS